MQFYIVGRAILVHELPLSINHWRLEVVVRIVPFITRGSVTDFKINNLFRGLLIRR
jgi:hypothetical protein